MRNGVNKISFLIALLAIVLVQPSWAENRISGLTDFHFEDFWTGNSALDISACIETDNANDYRLRFSSADITERAFEHLSGVYSDAWTMRNQEDSSGVIPFFIYLSEGATATNNHKLDNGITTLRLRNASGTAFCSDSGNNINIQVWLSQFRWFLSPEATPGRYETTINVELLSRNGRNVLASDQFTISVIWGKEHLIQINGDIFLENRLNHPVTHTDLCIGLTGSQGADPLPGLPIFEGQNRSSYRLEVTSNNATSSDSSFKLKQGVETLEYRLLWRSNSTDQEFTPANNSHILEIDNARAAQNYASLKQSGSCSDTSGSEALIIELTELASSSGVYSDTLTLMISAE